MTAKKPAKRRSPGEGSVWSYKEKNGTERWAIGHPSFGTRRRDTKTGERWYSKTAAQTALRQMLVDASRGRVVDPSRQRLADYLDEWLAGHPEIGDSTRASYGKNIRLHIKPYLGDVPLASLTTANVTALYRKLEKSGRRDGKGELTGLPLSARTVRYVATILCAALQAAVDARPRLLEHNPAEAKQAKPPSAKAAKAPEMHPWNAAQLGAFLAWSAENSPLYGLWFVLACTGMRRGEALALRWRDFDLDAGTVSVRRSVGVVRVAGEGAHIKEGPTKTNKPRVVDLDAATVAVVRAWRRSRAGMALQLVRDDALVFGNHEGQHLHPERTSRTFKATLTRCAKALGDAAPPEIRLHDLRHTHATVLLADRENVKVVSERLGHASVTVTLTVYAHVMPGNQRHAANRFAELIGTVPAQAEAS